MMAKRSDNKRPRSVKAEFDNGVAATSRAGAAIVEKTFRSLGIKRLLGSHLPARRETATYSSVDVAYPFLAGLMLGGRGLIAAEALRLNGLDREIFGLETPLPTEGTVHNAFADMAGLARRSFDETYVPAGSTHASLDIFGRDKRPRSHRRLVPERPESARTGDDLAGLTRAVGRRCLEAIPASLVRLDNYAVLFGDATQLEVEGRCFDVAKVDRNGKKSIQWATQMLGPIVVAQSLEEGSAFEAGRLEGLLEACAPVAREFAGRRGVLALNDAAYFHETCLDAYAKKGWKYIVCANNHRQALERTVCCLDDALWTDTGPDDRRGWSASGTHVFAYRPGAWEREVTIVAARWRESDDLPDVWRYSFLATNLSALDLPAHRVKRHGFGAYVRILYSTKQGREDHYKTALEDFGLHHPPSGRLGVTEVFYALACVAVNAAMVIRYRVLKGEERGMRFWRFRQRYVCLAGRVKLSARTLTVTLFGASVEASFQTLWLLAFAEAGFL